MSDAHLLVLSSLAGGAKHGYAIQQEIASFAGVRLGPGTLYGAISRLEEAGLIESLTANNRRRPYRLTPSGRRDLKARIENLKGIVDRVEQALHP